MTLSLLIENLLNDSFPSNFLKGENFAHWTIFLSFFYFRKKDIIVDLGGGAGAWASRIAPLTKEVILVDAEAKQGHYEGSVNMAKKRMHYDNVNFIIADIGFLPLKSNSINKALMNQVLEHLEKPQAAISEAGRVLRKNGVLVVSTPYEPFLKRYKFPISELLRKIVPKNVRHVKNPYLMGSFVRNGYYGWMKEIGHLRLGFNLREIRQICRNASLEFSEHNYVHKRFCVWFWELGYCLPFASFALRPFSMLLYKSEIKMPTDGVDIICKFEKKTM